MDRQSLFERALSLWPSTIDLSAGLGHEEGVRNTQLHEIYAGIEKRVGHADHWHDLAAWAFHQSIWEVSETKLLKGEATVAPVDVPFALFDTIMRTNLKNDSWKEVRAEYDPALD